MPEKRSAVCACGKTSSGLNKAGQCSICAQSQTKQASYPQSYHLPVRPAQRQWSPPPSQPSSPRRSYDAPSSSHSFRSSGRHSSSVSEVFTDALSSSSDTSSGSGSLFPPSMHRSCMRPAGQSRRPSDTSSTRSSSSCGTPYSMTSTPSTPGRRSATPDVYTLESGYAPMAAGFARLSRSLKGDQCPADSITRGRTSSTRPSLDLEARMFSGPA